MEQTPLVGEFTPELLSRRGEMLAWLTAVLSFAAWTFASLTGRPVLSFIPVMSFIFLFAAGSISLGNWIDRNTLLRLDDTGVFFKNGLRRVHLLWAQVETIEVFASSWGRKVRVIGTVGHFDFRTLGEMTMGGEVKGRMGFAQGEAILDHMLVASDLKEVEHTGNSYYYGRK